MNITKNCRFSERNSCSCSNYLKCWRGIKRNPKPYITPMYQMLDKVKIKVGEVSHLNNQEKFKTMAQDKVGWNDILKEAEENCKGMTIKGNVRWPAVCNTTDLRAPNTNFGANSVQTMGKYRKFQGKKTKFKKNGHGKHDNGK